MLSQAMCLKVLAVLCTWMDESVIWVSIFSIDSWWINKYSLFYDDVKHNPSTIIYVNSSHHERDFMFTDEFKKSTSYITQDDRLQLLLTVFENMRIAADLKLGNLVSSVEKNIRVSCKQEVWKLHFAVQRPKFSISLAKWSSNCINLLVISQMINFAMNLKKTQLRLA